MSFHGTKFQDYCRYYKITHYADRKTYEKLNWVWAFVHKRIHRKKLTFPNYDNFMDYLIDTADSVPDKYKFLYQSVIREFKSFQFKYDEFIDNYKVYMTRLKGYAHHRKSKNLEELKNECINFLKRMRVGNNTDEETRDFIIMATYICDYLAISPEEIPSDLFATVC